MYMPEHEYSPIEQARYSLAILFVFIMLALIALVGYARSLFNVKSVINGPPLQNTTSSSSAAPVSP